MLSALLTTTFCLFVIFVIKKLIPLFQRVIFMRNALEGINCLPTHWFLGHIEKQNAANEELYLSRVRPPYINNYPKLTVRWLGFILGSLILYFPSVVQDLLQSEEPKDEFVYGTIKNWIGEGLLVSKGAKWRRNRKLLTGAFHFNMLKKYLNVFTETVETMHEKWKNKSTVSVFEDVSLMTLDSMLQCTMSSKTNCQQLGSNHPYIKAVYDLSVISAMRFFNVFLLSDFIFYNLTSLGRRFLKACKIAHEESEKIIKRRKNDLSGQRGGEIIGSLRTKDQEESKCMDFLDILLLARDENGRGLTDKEIRDEVDTFLFEGHDTTASGISWALYNLALYPELQERCRKEVVGVIGDKQHIEYSDINKLEYLTMFIKESLRLYPPVFAVVRQFSKPFKFNRGFGSDQMNVDESGEPPADASREFPASLTCAVRIFSLHRNPHVWDDPEKFDPSRFLPDNVSKRSPFSYIPFSAGPRNCIGQNFAMMEMKVALAQTLKRFRLLVNTDYPKPEIYPTIILKAKNDIHLKLEVLK